MSFLNNRDRSSYLDVLKPDLGYSVEYILGTTYSLDLDTLLMSSLSLCLGNSDDISRQQIVDPVAFLEGCRRLSEKSIILFESGQIKFHPKKDYNQLYYFIEQSLYSAKTPKGGVFHPKVWFVKYKNENEEEKFRFVCLSRNITFDTSWDFAFAVNGEHIKGQGQSDEGKDLARFFSELRPEKLKIKQAEIYSKALDDLKKVHFDIPRGLEVSFYPIGITKPKKKSDEDELPFHANEYERQCIVSPFLRKKFESHQLAKSNILISSAYEIHQLEEESKNGFEEILVMSDTLSDLKANDEEMGRELEDVGSDLHAKMYFLEKGKNAEIFLGSANATDAAFKQNVEFLVHLKGKVDQIGIDQFLNSDKDFSFRTVLQNYEHGKLSEEDQKLESLKDKAFKIKKALFLSLLCYDFEENGDAYKITLNFNPSDEWTKLKKELEFSAHVTLFSLPLRLSDSKSLLNENVLFDNLGIGELTSLFVFKISLNGLEDVHIQRIEGPEFPQKRSDHVIRSSIDSMDKFIRFLYLILQGGEVTVEALSGILEKGSQDGRGNSYLQIPLFEEILKSLARTPDKLTAIDKVIEGLGDTDHKIIPKEFLDIWLNVKEARKILNV